MSIPRNLSKLADGADSNGVLGTDNGGTGATSLSSVTVGNATTASNLASGSAGTIPYQSASGTTAMLSAGTAGQVLTSNGASAPVWSIPTGGSQVFAAFGATISM